MKFDYQVQSTAAPSTVAELQTALADIDGAIRVIGSGSKQARLPAPDRSVAIVRLDSMNRILRLDAEDMTCSVEPGISRCVLDRALAEKNLQLPCPDSGSLGGMFAAGDRAPLVPSAHSTRSLLLGLEGVLAEGLAFKSGAKVVKSVAGFDLQKLFVGSRGKMFIATCLHLKLRHSPEHSFAFRLAGLSRDGALQLFRELRTGASCLNSLFLHLDQGEHAVTGEFTGNARAIAQVVKRHQLTESKALNHEPCRPETGHETLEGFVRPSAIAKFLEQLPANTTVRITGNGQFETSLLPSDIDSLLPQLATSGCSGEIRFAAAERRGRCTPSDATSVDLSRRIAIALDPNQKLA